MSKKQTAVEWLASSLGKYSAYWNVENYYNDKGERIKYLVIKIQPEKIDRFILKAKQMEKEQIIQSWHNGYNNQSPMIDEENCGNTYYNETYGGDHE
jgi:hypothetical protein